jgi:hypothetical protein
MLYGRPSGGYKYFKRISMEQDYKKQIEEIMSEMKCSRDFMCCKSGRKPLCKAKGLPIKDFVGIEGEPPSCEFSVSFGGGYYCKCPLHVFIKNHRK